MKFFLLLFVIALLQVPVICTAEKDQDPSLVIKQDLNYIKCEVCERAVAALIEEVNSRKEEQEKLFKKKPIDEMKILEVIENVCKPNNETGEWIRSLDIQENTFDKKKYLHVVEPGGMSKCKSECLTIAKSCEDLFENELDMDDLSAMLWKKKLTIEDAQVIKRCLFLSTFVRFSYCLCFFF
jgi:predicted small secreted protein